MQVRFLLVVPNSSLQARPALPDGLFSGARIKMGCQQRCIRTLCTPAAGFLWRHDEAGNIASIQSGMGNHNAF